MGLFDKKTVSHTRNAKTGKVTIKDSSAPKRKRPPGSMSRPATHTENVVTSKLKGLFS